MACPLPIVTIAALKQPERPRSAWLKLNAGHDGSGIQILPGAGNGAYKANLHIVFFRTLRRREDCSHDCPPPVEGGKVSKSINARLGGKADLFANLHKCRTIDQTKGHFYFSFG